MLKKIGIGLAIALAAVLFLGWFYLSSDDEVKAVLSDEPAGGVSEANYLIRSEDEGQTVLTYPLATTHGLRSNGVIFSEGKAHGKDGVFVKSTPRSNPLANDDRTMAVLAGSDFHNGVIELELNGSVSPGSSRLVKLFARAFIGVCFRVSERAESFECLYLRPENGQAEDETRAKHAVQYISAPGWGFAELREEDPEKYENPADIAPGKWHKVRIEVEGGMAKLFIDGGAAPVLEVAEMKLGADQKGSVGLWVGPGTKGFFRNLKITKTD